MISQEVLDKYKKIYKKHFKKDISNEEAIKQAVNLLTLVKVVYRPMTREEYELVQARRKKT